MIETIEITKKQPISLTAEQRKQLDDTADRILDYYKNPAIKRESYKNKFIKKLKDYKDFVTSPRGITYGLLGVYEMSRLSYRTYLISQGVDTSTFDPISYFILHNTGDLINGFDIPLFVDNITYKLPEKVRRPLSFAAGLAAVTFVETVLPNGDYYDMPAGIVGTILHDRLAFGKKTTSE